MSNVPEGVARDPNKSSPVEMIMEVDSSKEGVDMTASVPITCEKERSLK